MSKLLTWSSAILPNRIRKYLEKCPPAISGQNGHDQAFKLACALVWGFALPLDDALFYLRIWNAKCEPPWSEKELAHKVNSVLKMQHRKPIGHLL
jgi:hypothetical protein